MSTHSIEDTLSSSEGPELEIEKKFSIPDAEAAKKMEKRLASLGFEVTRREDFVDWYFDLPAPHWHFSLMDCWFRYREKKVKVMNNWGWKGAWQVKRGQKKEDGGDDTMENDGMTVYEELQGKDAKELILNMIAELGDISSVDETSSSSASNNMHYDHDIPYLAGAERLVPFARLETFRTCYETTKSDEEFSSLKVDVDKTNFGHMVGEVEAVIKDDDADDKMQVDAAKKQITKLVNLISSECATTSTTAPDSMAAIGKLEYYLMNNQPEHYNACVKAGVI